MSPFLSIIWNAVQNYTLLALGGEHQPVIIEQVEPPSQVNPLLSAVFGTKMTTVLKFTLYETLQNPYKYFLDETNMKRSLKGAGLVLIAAYVFVKVNFCMFRAARGILTIVGLLTVCCLVVEKYESLPEPVILVLNTMRINSFDLFQKFYKYVNSLNIMRR